MHPVIRAAIRTIGKCDGAYIRTTGLSCGFEPGARTGLLEGYGHCYLHRSKEEKEAWAMAADVLAELDVSPWEALLIAVRRSAGRVYWIDEQLAQAIEDEDEEATWRWLRESRAERAEMARVAKGAIDAGVAERMVHQVEESGKLAAKAVTAALDVLQLTPKQRMKAFKAIDMEIGKEPLVING